jgi:hypothetical protein
MQYFLPSKIAWQTMYVSRNIEARSLNHSRSGKAISITYYERAFLTFVILHAKRMSHTTLSLWPIYHYHIFPYCFINGTVFRKKNYST